MNFYNFKINFRADFVKISSNPFCHFLGSADGSNYENFSIKADIVGAKIFCDSGLSMHVPVHLQCKITTEEFDEVISDLVKNYSLKFLI